MKNSPNRSFTAYLALFGGLFFMSFSAIFIRLSDAPGIVTSFYRMAVGSCILIFPVIFYMAKKKPVLSMKGVGFAILAGLCFGCDMSFWSTGVAASNATIPTILANTSPIWVGLGSMFFFKEKHKFGFWSGIILAFAGILFLIKNGISSHGNIVFGALMGLTAGVFYSTFILISQPGRQMLNTLLFLFISTLTSAIVLFFATLIFGFSFTGYDSRTTLIFLVYGLCGQVITWSLVNYAQGHLPASLIAPTLLGQPLGTALLAIVILREYLTVWHLTAGAIIVSGIYIVYYSRRKGTGSEIL